MLLQECKVDSNTPEEVNCFSFTLWVISVPIQHHPNKRVSDQASNTTVAHAVNSGHADCLGTAGLQPSPDAPGWRPCMSRALQQSCLFLMHCLQLPAQGRGLFQQAGKLLPAVGTAGPPRSAGSHRGGRKDLGRRRCLHCSNFTIGGDF